jgi:hypothetical protein
LLLVPKKIAGDIVIDLREAFASEVARRKDGRFCVILGRAEEGREHISRPVLHGGTTAASASPTAWMNIGRSDDDGRRRRIPGQEKG